MLRCISLIILLLSVTAAHASPNLTGSSLIGLWLTQDHDGVMAVTPCGGGLCVRIAAVILDQPTDPTPTDYRGVSQCHLTLVDDARQVEPNLWQGHIIDPRNGRLFGVELHLNPHGELLLRGFLGIPLLGQTQTWTRYTGPVPQDCRLYSQATVVGQTQ